MKKTNCWLLFSHLKASCKWQEPCSDQSTTTANSEYCFSIRNAPCWRLHRADSSKVSVSDTTKRTIRDSCDCDQKCRGHQTLGLKFRLWTFQEIIMVALYCWITVSIQALDCFEWSVLSVLHLKMYFVYPPHKKENYMFLVFYEYWQSSIFFARIRCGSYLSRHVSMHVSIMH